MATVILILRADQGELGSTWFTMPGFLKTRTQSPASTSTFPKNAGRQRLNERT